MENTMNRIQVWASNNMDTISFYIEEKRYYDLLKIYEKESGLSQVKLAAALKCDRRSIRRYLTGERAVPMGLVSLMLKTMGVDYKSISTGKEQGIVKDEDENGSLIWYGGTEILLNTLYFHRTKDWKQSRFELACRLNLDEEILAEYEHGKKRIPPTVVDKILEECNLKLTVLFPTIKSYDGGNTYMQLDVEYVQSFGGKKYDLFEDELYAGPDGEYADCFLPNWPAWRYDSHTKPLLKYMPDELTMDEYYNTDPIYFIKDMGECKDEFYEADFSNKKLPPSYQYIQDFYDRKKYPTETTAFDLVVKEYNLDEDYSVWLRVGSRKNQFDLKQYVFSDSLWYQMLQDKEYFKNGILENRDDPCNSCLRWPDGQYIRIVELYIEKYKYRHYKRARVMSGCNWLEYE